MSDTILSEGRPKPEKEWPGLFTLYCKPNGQYRAEFGTITAPIEWALRWKLDKKEKELASALVLLRALEGETIEQSADSKGGESTRLGPRKAGQENKGSTSLLNLIVSKFESAVGSELRIITGTTKSQRVRLKAKKDMEKMVSHVLGAFIYKGKRPAHGKAFTVQSELGPRTLAWAVLETARKLVEKHHCLPTKDAIKEALVKATQKTEAKAETVSSGQWAKAFKDAGLSELPKKLNAKSKLTKTRGFM